MPEPGQRADLARLHVGSCVVVHMVVAQQVQRAVNHQVGGMLLQRDALVRGLGAQTPGRE